MAYRVALAGNFISGMISVVLGALGPQMLTIIPPAALLVPLAGNGFAFLGLEQTVAPFGAPMVGFMVSYFIGALVWRMNRLTRDGTAEPVSRDQILRHARGQGNVHFPCSAGHEQDWQPYPVDPYSALCDDHTYIHTP